MSAQSDKRSASKAEEFPFEQIPEVFRSGLDSSLYLFYVKDEELRYRFVNNTFLETWGIKSADDIIGKTNDEAFLTENPRINEIDRRALAGEEVEDVVEKPGEDGMHWIHTSRTPIRDKTGKIRGIFVVARDISSLVRVQQELMASEERFRIIVESAQDGIWVKDAEHRFTHVNPAFVKLWESKAENFIGRKHEEIFGSASPELFETERRVLSGEVVEEQFFLEGKREGDKRYFSDVRAPLRNGNGEIVGLAGIRRELTEQMRLQETLRRTSRIEATATLAGGVAHDFNNLMAVVLGNADFLKMSLADNQAVQPNLEAIIRSAERAGDLSQQLLAYARGGKPMPKVMNLQKVVDEMLPLHEHFLPKSVELESEFEPSLWDIRADPSQMGQIVINLGLNAVEAINGKGRIFVKTQNVTVDMEMAAANPGLGPGRYVCFTVEDNGCGMDPATKERIYEPFFTTKTQGRGLGLSAVYGIVQGHRGHIALQSEKGKGTRFDVYLPATEKPADRKTRKPKAVPRGTETILVVDDEELVLLIIDNILRSLGYTVLLAPSGEAALEIARAKEQKIDLVILDLEMPVMTGIETMELLRKERPDLKVIVCSGYDTDYLAKSDLGREVSAFVRKPFKIDALAPAIRAALGDPVAADKPTAGAIG